MKKLINHIVLGELHMFHYKKQDGTIRIEVLTEEEYSHLSWWKKTKLKYNL